MIDEGRDWSWQFNRRWSDGARVPRAPSSRRAIGRDSVADQREGTGHGHGHGQSEAVAPLVAGAATGLLEHAMVLFGQPAAALAGDLRQDFIKASVKLLLGEDRHRRRGLRARAFAGRPARP